MAAAYLWLRGEKRRWWNRSPERKNTSRGMKACSRKSFTERQPPANVTRQYLPFTAPRLHHALRSCGRFHGQRSIGWHLAHRDPGQTYALFGWKIVLQCHPIQPLVGRGPYDGRVGQAIAPLSLQTAYRLDSSKTSLKQFQTLDLGRILSKVYVNKTML